MSESQALRTEADFTHALIEATTARKTWRERLQWLRDRFADPAFAPTLGELATVVVYLRFLASGELKGEEDGRHFRPNHSAEAAMQIDTALERLAAPEIDWIARRIHPYLPSWGDEFRRAEPLTRIRDIAHRNDIPQELKKEIKHRLQNKLHRSAGPEDLRTSEELLRRITAPGASYSPAFVHEFQVFHAELQEFFNATALEDRLRALARSSDAAVTEKVNAFLNLKAVERPSDDQLLDLLGRLTEFREFCAAQMPGAVPRRRSQLRLTDIGLEDYAFTVLSECANRLRDLRRPDAWAELLRALTAALDNLRLSLIEPEESGAVRSELSAWAVGFNAEDRFHLLRLLATLARARRLAETYTDRINQLFPPRVFELGRGLGVAEEAIKVFSEGDVRGHVVFQLSRLVDVGLQAARAALRLPPWEAIVPGEALGTLTRAASFAEVEGASGPLVLLLEYADGDAELPAGVKGIALAHPLPHLSHLGVRARQARVPFAACADRDGLRAFDNLVGKGVRLRVTADGLSMEEAPLSGAPPAATPAGGTVAVPEAVLAQGQCIVALDRATSATCGAKAAGAQRLLELAAKSGGLFRAPRGLAIPFGVMERCLDQAPDKRRAYDALRERLAGAGEQLDAILEQLRALVSALPVPAEVGKAVAEFFAPDARLAVRSSANGEDLEQLAGAGLYDSVVNVPVAEATQAIARVWASLWTRRATLSRTQAGIPDERIYMAVLLQELVGAPELSFILHTAHPVTGDRGTAVAEMAVGLGEVLASAAVPGAPYRMTCDRRSNTTTLTSCATFSVALYPAPQGGVRHERLDYAHVPLSTDPGAAPRLGGRLAAVAGALEDGLGGPQDIEGVCVGDDIHIVQARPQQGLAQT